MNKKYKGFSFEDGRIVDTAYIHGYNFGDRLMEDVYFKVIVINGELKCSILEKDKDYFKQFNIDFWLKSCLNYCLNSDDEEYDEKEDGRGEALLLEILE